MDLVSAWQTVDLNTRGPRILECDREVLKRRQRGELDVCYASWQEVSLDLSNSKDRNQLHLNRIPVPYVGDLSKASIFILTLNPGHELADYYFEFEDDPYGQALVNNLKQENLDIKFPFFYLNPRFSTTGGYSYWFPEFKEVITRLMVKHKVTFDEAHSKLAQEIAVIEQVPYASVNSKPLESLSDELCSRRLAMQYVKNHVRPKVLSSNAIAIVQRGKRWDEVLDQREGVIRNNNPRNRHLSAEAKEAIVEMLS
ncbi:MAG: hypothetical protein F4Y63_09025 [Chloroflexi bacterium]|nr:hypothetical protein [Chloroflexota bacterium]MYF79480.1 hypothetical protein [Chloroflexota bacterium]MYK60426.1 hypothetical protein [Chloroflexota bacterium]